MPAAEPFPVPSAPSVPAPRRPTRTLHLAAAIDGRELYEAAYYVELARLAERGSLDFVTLGGGAAAAGGGRGAGGAGPGRAGGGGGGLDALGVLARVAPATDRIGLVPAVVAAGADAVETAKAIATLDWVSRGRAGWTVAVPEGEPGVRQARRRVAEHAEAHWRAAETAAGTVARVWDAAAEPRTPRGRPVTMADATDPAAQAAAARLADIAFVRAARPEGAARLRAELRRRAAEAGRDPDRLLVLAELRVDLGGGEVGPEPGIDIVLIADGTGGVLFSGGPVDLAELIVQWQRSGAVDGFHIRPVEPRRDLERFVNGTVALLQHRGLFRAFQPGATLREHLGLHRPAPRLAVTGGTPR